MRFVFTNKLIYKLKAYLSLVLLGFTLLGSEAQNITPPTPFTCKCSHALNTLQTFQFTEQASYSEYDLVYHKIHWNIDPAERFIQGSVYSLIKILANDVEAITFDMHDDLIVDSVKQGNKILEFVHQNHSITVSLEQSKTINDTLSFTVYYQGIPPKQGSNSFSTRLRNGTDAEMWTLSEPYGAREWWPCKQSLSDKIDSIDIIISVPDTYKTASNGLPIKETVQDGFRTTHWKHRYPIATYLVAVAATNYESFSDVYYFNDGDSMMLMNLMYPEYVEEAKIKAEQVPGIFDLFHEHFMDYPFKKEWYGHAQFGRGGGMEHQTMSFMGNLNFELVAHELAHQWFGNYITLNSWHDIFLNEGFATYLQALSVERMQPELWDKWKQSVMEDILSETDGSVYVEDTTSTRRVFNQRLTYYKGAYLLRMLQWELGDEVFFQALRNYLNDEEVAYHYASIKKLISHLETTADTTLTEFFNDWYYGEGFPEYTAFWKQKGDSLQIEVNQTTSHYSVIFYEMHVPIRIYTDFDTLDIRLHHTYSGEKFSVFIEDKTVKDVLFDPETWLVGKSSIRKDVKSPTYNDHLWVYPIPAKTVMHIKNTNNRPLGEIKLYDLQGKQVHSTNCSDVSYDLSTTEFNTGIYLLYVKDNPVRKILISR